MTSSSKSEPRIVRCPTCGGPSVYGPENPFRPFCSERCKLQDLGAWASERYRVPESRPSSSDAKSGDGHRGAN